MTSSSYYHEQAELACAEAHAEPLAQRRQRHEASAQRWREMALAAEETEQRTIVNAAERQAKPYHQTTRTDRSETALNIKRLSAKWPYLGTSR